MKEAKEILKREKRERKEADKYHFKSYLLFKKYDRFDKFNLSFGGSLYCGDSIFYQAETKEKYEKLVQKLENIFKEVYKVGDNQ